MYDKNIHFMFCSGQVKEQIKFMTFFFLQIARIFLIIKTIEVVNIYRPSLPQNTFIKLNCNCILKNLITIQEILKISNITSTSTCSSGSLYLILYLVVCYPIHLTLYLFELIKRHFLHNKK